MSGETYFAVINDNSVPSAPEYEECIAYCRDGAGNPLVVRDREDALYLRDKHREGDDNPDINVYRVTVHEGSVERENGGDAGE